MKKTLPTQEEFAKVRGELRAVSAELDEHTKGLKQASLTMRTQILWEAKAETIYYRLNKAIAKANAISDRVEAYKNYLYGKPQ